MKSPFIRPYVNLILLWINVAEQQNFSKKFGDSPPPPLGLSNFKNLYYGLSDDSTSERDGKTED
jgi:hypothetical protein